MTFCVLLQETAHLYEHDDLQDVFEGQYNAEFQLSNNDSRWTLMHSCVTAQS